jgi:VWFA-related protein
MKKRSHSLKHSLTVMSTAFAVVFFIIAFQTLPLAGPPIVSAPPPAFIDVPPGYWAETAIYKIYNAGITTGCSQDPPMYCPENTVTRTQMAVFLGRAIHGSSYIPPSAIGYFSDVPVSYWAADWIEEFYRDGITGGCGINPPRYCPYNNVTRAQMAIFLLRSKHGKNYTPPAASGIFTDVPTTYWAADWIEQLYLEGITTGCGIDPPRYCPDSSVTRAQMAVFIVRTFEIGEPSIQVLPSSYDFGIVTPGNSPAPLEVEIANNGLSELTVSDIALSDTTNFVLDLSGGSNPCNTKSPTIVVGDNCTAEVDFLPASNGSFDATLIISSDDPNHSTINVPLSGIREPISELNVRINQIEACPRPAVTAYVSVTDQGGYPVTGLTQNDFLVTEAGGYVGLPTTVSFVSDTTPTISVALVMDYSYSISKIQDNLDDMEESVSDFVDQLKVGDEAEIIKFSDDFDVVQAFTSDKDLLKAAISSAYPDGVTDFYDAVYQAVDDTAARSKDRRAVIVITDGGNDFDTYTFADVINNANTKGVPIFTVGIGQVNSAILTQMADDTGGQFYEATTPDNLRTIYQQLANVLFADQYILTYTSLLGDGETADLTIGATLVGVPPGSDTKGITSCP